MLTKNVKKIALDIGFHKIGVAEAALLKYGGFLPNWLQNSYHGSMWYMENNVSKRMDVRELYPQAKSVISLAQNYYTADFHSRDTWHAKISRYAWGADYHKIMKKKLKLLLREIQKLDRAIEGRVFVDTAPIMDKQWAVASGVGWQGKHSNVITREYGSWVFLGEIVIDKELVYDTPIGNYCGRCTACIDNCPTHAIVSPYVVDARKCISYLTIEFWDLPIPELYYSKMGNWVFGCDICQAVCPWNKKYAQLTNEQRYQARKGNLQLDLRQLSQFTQQEFDKRFQGSAIRRAKYKNFLRNVHVALCSKEQEIL